MNKIQKELFKNQDIKYRDFSAKLTPTIDKKNFIGVRVPVLRKLAKNFSIEECSKNLPHKYVEENTLHGLVISDLKDYNQTIKSLEEFLPYVDNWATCDIMSPKCFKLKKDREKTLQKLKNEILRWIKSDKIYTIRFAIEMVMSHYLDEYFDQELMKVISKIKSGEYYVNMMIAWYFATALAKQWDATLPFIKNQTMDNWTHNKTIQKAIESNRISSKDKSYLRTLKIK